MHKIGIDLGTPAFGLPSLGHVKTPPASCSDADVRTVFGAFGLADLQRLDGAFQRGQVVRRIFHAGGGRGCLLYHLNNAIVSFGAQTLYFAGDRAAFHASQQLIAAWDSDALSEEHVRALLSEAIQAQQKPRDSSPTRPAEGLDVSEPRPTPNRDRAVEARRPAARTRGDNRPADLVAISG